MCCSRSLTAFGPGALARVSSIHIEMFRDLNGPAFTRYLSGVTDRSDCRSLADVGSKWD